MKRPEHLTDAEARTLTRREILDRVETEQAYWLRKRGRMTEEDRAQYRELMQIMYAYIPPAAGLDALRDTLEGRPSDYWETRPGEVREDGKREH